MDSGSESGVTEHDRPALRIDWHMPLNLTISKEEMRHVIVNQ